MGRSRDRADVGEFSYVSGILALSGGVRLSCAALLAGASLVALGASNALAQAWCPGSNQTISTPTTSIVQSNGGNITITNSGSITANLAIALSSTPTACSARTINNAGAINYSVYGVFN
jgi:hypothetical protein